MGKVRYYTNAAAYEKLKDRLLAEVKQIEASDDVNPIVLEYNSDEFATFSTFINVANRLLVDSGLSPFYHVVGRKATKRGYLIDREWADDALVLDEITVPLYISPNYFPGMTRDTPTDYSNNKIKQWIAAGHLDDYVDPDTKQIWSVSTIKQTAPGIYKVKVYPPYRKSPIGVSTIHI